MRASRAGKPLPSLGADAQAIGVLGQLLYRLLRVVQPINFIEGHQYGRMRRPDFGQSIGDGSGLFGGVVMGNVYHVQN